MYKAIQIQAFYSHFTSLKAFTLITIDSAKNIARFGTNSMNHTKAK